MNVSLGVINNQYEEENDSDTDKSDEGGTPLRTVVQEIKKTYILLLTPIWEEVLYETACDLGTQYYYIIYDKNTEPKYHAREVRLNLYQDQECAKGPNIHAH